MRICIKESTNAKTAHERPSAAAADNWERVRRGTQPPLWYSHIEYANSALLNE